MSSGAGPLFNYKLQQFNGDINTDIYWFYVSPCSLKLAIILTENMTSRTVMAFLIKV
jgi:hypothetical protein